MLALLLALLAAPAHAGDEELRAAVQRQEVVVDALAADVATARAAGASRQDLGTRMSLYRAEAVRLAAMAAPLFQSEADTEQAAHADAERRLADALASDHADDPSRVALIGWLGEPSVRVGLVETVARQAGATIDPVVRHALALDLAEQAGALALVCRYDAAKARRDGARATAQASAFRARTAPGQSGGLDLVVAAERAERETSAASAAVIAADALASRYDAVRAAMVTLSEGTP